MRLKLFLAGALALAVIGSPAFSAPQQDLRKLAAPAPMDLRPISNVASGRAVKFSRVVAKLSAGPWAYLFVMDGRNITEEYLPWTGGQKEIDAQTFSGIFADEMRAAQVTLDGSSDSLFASDTSADLQVGVSITDLKGRFCSGCGALTPITKWKGAVTMNAKWEIYSGLEGRVVATVTTQGGYGIDKSDVNGTPERLMQEAFRDNTRRLIASEEFRRLVTSSPLLPASKTSLPPVEMRLASAARQPVSKAAEGVAMVFTGDGHGSGFLISSDGYLLTNHHVVSGAKYVKVRWSDGAETLGEVIRSDRRRDVALVKVDAGSRTVLQVRNTSPTIGEAVFAIGAPLDGKFQGTVTKGIVSASRTYEGQSFIQSDVAVNPGNSGGPLLDESGAALGLSVSGYSVNGASVGLNLFIPIGDALTTLSVSPRATTEQVTSQK